MANTRCRIGLVGAGRAANRHASVLSRFHDVSIVGVTDPDVTAAAALAARTGSTVAPTLSALVGLHPHAVFVCVPPHAHGPIEDELLDAGVPMFIEAPLGVDRDGPDALARRVASAGVLTAVGHHWRYSAAVSRARSALTGRPIRLVTGSWLGTADSAQWWGRRDQSGGPLIEQVVHLLDLLRALVGEAVEVYAMGDDMPLEGADFDGVTAATLRFASGAVGTLATTCRFAPRAIDGHSNGRQLAELEVYADGAGVRITEDGCEIRVGDRSEWHAVDADAAVHALDRAFVDAVRRPEARSGVLVDYAQAVRSHRLAHALTRSASEGRPLRLRAD